MHDPEYRRSWDSLLDDLGVPGPVKPETPAPAAPAPTPGAPEAAAPVPEEPAAPRGRRRRSQPTSEATSVPGEAGAEPADNGGRGRRRRRGKATEEETAATESAAISEPVSVDPEESGEAAVPPLPVEAAETEAGEGPVRSEGGESGTEPRRRRRRRRGRKQPDAEVAASVEEPDEEEDVAADEVVSEEPAEPAQEEEEDDEEFEDLTDLAVPSWGELVASLYRPPDR